MQGIFSRNAEFFLPVLENKCKIIKQEVNVFTKDKARGLVNCPQIFESLCYERE
jgi:hypothetical protein